MKAIETIALVGDDRRVTVQLPADVAPGTHRLVVVVEEPLSHSRQPWTMNDWPVHDARLTDPDFAMHREELYGDNGR